MCGDAELRDLVHLAGADLHLDALALGTDHAGMQRAVIVRLGRRDVVLEAAGHHGIGAVEDAERVIALLDRVDGDAERHDVGKLLETDILALHLAPDRVRTLLAAGYLRIADAALAQYAIECRNDPRDEIAALLAQEGEARLQALPRIGIELGESEILELVLHAMHADALGERRVNVHRLARDAASLVVVLDVVERLHIVQAVGELDEEDANVFRHRQHQLAEVLRLLRLVRLQLDARQLGDAVDQPRDVWTEQPLDVLERRDGVLDGIVQQAGNDR